MSYLSIILVLLLTMGIIGSGIIRNSIPNKIKYNNVSTSSNAAGTINTIAGNGFIGGLVTGSSPTSVGLSSPTGVAVDSNGNYFIAVKSENVVDMIPKTSGTYYGIAMTAGDIYTIAGMGTAGAVTSDVLATTTNLDLPMAVSIDSSGNVYIADYRNNDVEMIASGTCSSSCLYGLSSTTPGYIYIIESGSSLAFCSSNGQNQAIYPNSVFATDSNPPELYFGDSWTDSIYELTTAYSSGVSSKSFSTVAGPGLGTLGNTAGCGNNAGNSGDGGLAIYAHLNLGYSSIGLQVDSQKNLLITDKLNNQIRMVANANCFSNCPYGLLTTTANYIYTIAGNVTGTSCTQTFAGCGDGGPAVNALLNEPDGLAIDAAGNVYVSDYGDNRIWSFTSTGLIFTYVANYIGQAGFAGDGYPAQQAWLNEPENIAIDSSGDILIADTANNRIRQINAIAIGGPLTTGVGPTGQNILGGHSCTSAGDPVECSTGDYYTTATDLSIPFRDMPLEATRTYNSLASTMASPLGFGWSANYLMSISFDGSQNATVTQESGNTATFNYCATVSEYPGCTTTGIWVSPSWQFASLADNSGIFIYTRDGHQIFNFVDLNSSQTLGTANTTGVITSQQDLNGYVESYNYCTVSTGCKVGSNTYPNLALESITDPAGRSLTFSYNDSSLPNNITSIVDQALRFVTYSYDSNDNLTQVSLNPGPNFPNDPVRTWNYGYTLNHLLVSTTDPNSNVSQVAYSPIVSNIDSTNHINSISCTSDSFCIAVDNVGNALIYNGSAWSSSTIDSNQSLSSVSCVTPVFCIAVDQGSPANAFMYNGSTWTESTGVDSHPLDSISCNATTFCMAVDNNGNYLTYSGSAWSSVSNIDSSNVLESVSCTIITSTSSTLCVAVDNAGNALTYNGSTWTTTNIDLTNQLTGVSCTDNVSELCAAVDAKGNGLIYNGTSWTTPTSIDSTNQLTGVSCAASTYCVVVDSLGNAITFFNLKTETPISIDSSLNISSISCGAINSCYGVDTSGNVIPVDTMGQALSTTQVCQTNDTSCNTLQYPNRTTSFVYSTVLAGTAPNQYPVTTTKITDPNGNVTIENFVQNTLVSETDGLGSATQRTIYYSYTSSSSLSTSLEPLAITDPNGQVTTYTYDPTTLQKTSQTDPMGRVSIWTWNAFDEMTSYEPPQTTAESDPVVTYNNYNSTNGNLECSVTVTNEATPTDPSCSTSSPSVLQPETVYTYGNGTINSNGTVGTVGSNGGWPSDAVTIDKVNYSGDPANVTNYTYDAQGYVTQSTVVLSPINQITTYVPNTNTGTITCSVNPNGYATLNTSNYCGSPSGVTQYSYNDLNEVLGTLTPTGGLTLKGYDSKGLLTGVQTDPDANSLTPDDTGTAGSDSDSDTGSSSLTANPEGTTAYAYNSFDEQISITTPLVSVNGATTPTQQTTTKTYDNNGNLLSVTDPDGHVTSYTYDSLNRLASQTTTTGVTTSYTHDPNGNVLVALNTNSSGLDTSNFYSYNADNELTAYTLTEPGTTANLTQISCGYSTDCMAIGTTNTGAPAIVSGSPNSWTSETIPSGVATLNDVSCSTQTDCYVTGTTTNGAPTIEYTANSGSTWTSLPTGLSISSVGQISCPSTTTCFASAVVSNSNTLITTTNSGSTWSVVSSSPTFPVNSLTCVSTTQCYVGGNSSGAGVISYYSSGIFTSETLPSGVTNISSISCGTTSQCVAVGQSSAGPVILSTTNSGTTWSTLTVPSGVTALNSVNCPGYPSATDCYASGSSTTGSSTNPAIVHITYNSSTTTWAAATETPSYGISAINAIGCGSNSGCVAVGSSQANSAQIINTTNSGANWSDNFDVNNYTYDQDGHELSMQDGQGTTGITNYTYDPLGRLTSQTNEFGTITSYQYDLVNNMTSITYPNNNTVRRTFDGANQLTSVTTWLSDTTCSGSLTPDTTTFTYDLDGNLLTSTLPTCDTGNTPNGPDVINRTYNSDNTLNTISGTFNGHNASIVYSTNGLGYVTNRNVNSGASVTSYVYNAMGQITNSTTGTTSTNFQYDAAGNLTCNQSGQYQTYDSLGELQYNYQTCGSTATLQDTFTYDAYGDRTQELVPWGTGTIPLDYEYYNSVGEMTGYTAFFTQTNYSYSGNGQLIQISQGSTNLYLTYNEAVPIPQILSDNNWDFIYGPNNQVFEAILLPTSSNPTPTPYYLINDINGSPLANLSSSGTVNNVTPYNTWGAATQSSTAPPIGFDNAYYDGIDDFYYMMNRFYDPNTGQFITQDPRILATNQPWGYAGVASPSSGGTMSTNPMGIDQTQIYQFANDNPVTLRDMSGLCSNKCNSLTMQGVNAFVLMSTVTMTSTMIDVPLLAAMGPAGLIGALVLGGIGLYLVDDEASHALDLAKMACSK
jgi:RHS repeat-associated protein